MSTKPAIALARWADLITSNVVDAPSGLRDTGYLDNTPIEADLVNGLLKQYYLWALYLNDGALSGNHTVDGTLGVTGATSVGGALSVTSGGAAITGNSSVTGTLGVTAGLTVSAGGAAVTGNSSVTGTLGVSGTLNANGGITVPTGQAVALNGTTTLNVGGLITPSGGVSAFTATGLITANAGVTAAANQHFTVSGTGDFKHGDRVIAIHAAAFHAAGNNSLSTPINTSSGGIAGSAWRGWAAAPNDTIVAGIPLRVGDRIKSVIWFLFKASNATAMTFAIKAYNGSAAESGVALASDVSSGGTVSTNTISGINHTLVVGEQLSIKVTATVTAQEFYGCEITYDHP